MAKKKAAKKPKGWSKFDRLARRLVKVPKEEAQKQRRKKRGK